MSIAGWVIWPSLMVTPVALAYAILAHQALDVRLIIRRAVQYAFARYTVVAVATMPLLLIVVGAYRHRTDTADIALFNTRNAWLVGLSAMLLLILQARQGILDRIDRAFFREQYDAQRTMRLLVDNCRWASTDRELATILRNDVSHALHPTTIDLLLLDGQQRSFVSPLGRVRRLSADSAIAKALHGSESHVDMRLIRQDSIACTLTPDDQHWVADGDCSFLLPLRDADHQLIGIVVLGEKMSELPYTESDWRLLSAAGASAEMAVVYHGMRSRPVAVASLDSASDALAAECPRCGQVSGATLIRCARCDSAVEQCSLPHVLVGKYQLEERLGEGGMGVVYRATDLDLGRSVALKTLPYASPDGAMRLRREARAMAQVAHPNLALIYGAESWKGRPLLSVEFLPGRTLADRLTTGPLAVHEMLELGVSLSAALKALHAAGIYHRDIKPSNIGYAVDGTPKLLDFGLARMVEQTVEADALGVEGTMLYLPPEAIDGQVSGETADLWALSLVLYEAVSGHNPLFGGSLAETRARVRAAQLPDVREKSADCTPDVAQLFRDGLSLRPSSRPKNAAVLNSQLSRLHVQLLSRSTTARVSADGSAL